MMMMDIPTIEDILDTLAWEGCRLFTELTPNGYEATIDRPETGYERWDTLIPMQTKDAAIRDVYARFLPSAMGGRDAE